LEVSLCTPSMSLPRLRLELQRSIINAAIEVDYFI